MNFLRNTGDNHSSGEIRSEQNAHRRQEDRKRILVAGGAGFLGSHLCERLLGAGHQVICIDNFSTGLRRNIEHLKRSNAFSVIAGDIAEPIDLDVDEIYNLAYSASPHYQADPIHTTKTCVIGSLNLLELAARRRARIFQASTPEAPREPNVQPQAESYWGNVNPFGTHSYDRGKRCAEAMFFDFRKTQVGIKIIRIFNTYGPRMRVDDGRIISNFIVQALKGENITIYGNGSRTRSFCFIDDLIDGFVRVMASSPSMTGPFNLGNPEEFTIDELAEQVVQLTGSRSKIIHRPLPINHPRQPRPDISLAMRELDWRPKVNLSAGLARTIRYFDGLLAGADQTLTEVV
ncbi:UDP-glucuronic acid decarboxylase family protein [Pararhizobium sp. YC-54]|uniref:UDP-glucuronic acid decarboxylase family protein n=1 Tax=Pararhizobium sp. YC-54 TaxID=2986920 RepID=UPI003556D590